MGSITEFSFWQLWPQFEQNAGERHVIGYELELIGYHKSDPSHVDPTCPMCQDVRSELLAIAHRMVQENGFRRESMIYRIDPRSNAVLCLPALGNRSAVCVTVTIFWRRAEGQAIETELLGTLKASLSKHGLHQR
jgi:hypothetical protein